MRKTALKGFFCRLLPFIIVLLTIESASSQQKSALKLEKVEIPKSLGVVNDCYEAGRAGDNEQKTIFYIQDIHANYQAQKNLAGIIVYLVETYGVNLILVEGGITDKDFSYIRSWAPLEERKAKAEGLLKDGVITGETYVDIATDLLLKFQGIEDKGLYEENMGYYLKVDSFKNEALKVVHAFISAADNLKGFIYTKRLKEFDDFKRRYDDEKMLLVEYAEFLDAAAAKEKIGLEEYPNHVLLLKSSRLEKKIDFDIVEKERDGLLEALADIMSKEDSGGLMVMSLRFGEDKISAGEFYPYLCETASKHGADMRRFGNIERYADYIKSCERLNDKELFKEIKAIEGIISEALCKNEEQKALFKISKDIATLSRFLRLKLGPEEFNYYKANRSDFDISGWAAFLKKEAERFRIKDDIPQDAPAIEENLGTLESFYNVSFKRDEAFLSNSQARMEKDKDKAAILITGGFHTRNLSRLFRANGVSYIVITPKTDQKADDELYDRILKESYRTRMWE